MNRHGALTAGRADAARGALRAVANFAHKAEYCTMILDRRGAILTCGAPAERIFACPRNRLIGRNIADFIPGLCFGGNSPSFSARYLMFLSVGGEWREFEAHDASGRECTLELKLLRIASNSADREVLLLNVHRVGGGGRPMRDLPAEADVAIFPGR